MTDTSSTLAIVIIGRNEGVRLQRCFESVFAIQDWSGAIEVVYVDSGSSDGSCALAESFGVRVIHLQSDRPSAARGRNAGWRSSAAPLILFLDGDTILNSKFPATAAKSFTDANVAVVWGERRELHPERSIYNRVLDLDWMAPAGDSQFCGGDALMRRSVLEQVDGYDENLIAGEEPDMCRRMRALGHRILHLVISMTGHDLALFHWKQYWRRAVRTGYAYAEVSERYRETPLPLWTAESLQNKKRGAFWIAGSLLALAASTVLRTFLPLVAFGTLLCVLSARSAKKVSWKDSNWLTLFLYGLHSHIQHVPILVGQISYQRAKRLGRKRPLIEYKETTT